MDNAGNTLTRDFAPVVDLLMSADRLADRIGYPPPALRHAYHRQVLMLLSQAYVQVFGTRVENPDWVPHTGCLFPWGAPNHDTIYGFAPIDSQGTYRVAGVQGSEIIASLMFRRGGANTGEVHGATLSEIDVQALATAADRRFSLLLSRVRPTGYDGDWFAIPADATGLIARHITVAPDESDGTWSLERLDRAPAGDARTDADTAERAAAMTSFVARLNEFLLRLVRKLRDDGAVNSFRGERFQGHGGIAMQMYYQTLFEFDADEALILASELPDSVLYWSVQLLDPFYSGIDFVFHHAARNHRQCHIDPDGRVRCVIALDDPGVPNWLDPAGWRQGGIFWRWHTASSFPRPTVKKVKLAELRRHLPEGVAVVDAAARKAELAARISQYQSRRRW
jgi:hypothetical protein